MSFVQIWIHAVWGTKNRDPMLQKEIRDQVKQHIIENAKTKNFFIDCINGYTEHLHCLTTLNADLSVAKQMQLVKGESSFWINKNKLVKGHFEWADEYFAVSVSEDKLDNVRNYINNQEEHHKKITFLNEYDNFLKHFHFNKSQG
jgi:REP element-mobilizing transposase RayT